MTPRTVQFLIDYIERSQRDRVNSMFGFVSLTIESNNPGGEPGQFEKHMMKALDEWYTNSDVCIIPESEFLSYHGTNNNVEIYFYIYMASEMAAGLRGFNDTITFKGNLKANDPDKTQEEFENHMIEWLKEWYDGAVVWCHSPDSENSV